MATGQKRADPAATAQRGQPSVFCRFVCIRNFILARPAWLISIDRQKRIYEYSTTCSRFGRKEEAIPLGSVWRSLRMLHWNCASESGDWYSDWDVDCWCRFNGPGASFRKEDQPCDLCGIWTLRLGDCHGPLSPEVRADPAVRAQRPCSHLNRPCHLRSTWLRISKETPFTPAAAADQ